MIKKQQFTPACYYVFNNNLALVNFERPSEPHVVVIKSKPFADTYRQLFQNAWEESIHPPSAFGEEPRNPVAFP